MCDLETVVGNGIWRSECLQHGHTFVVFVAFAGCSIAKCGQAFSLFRIPNFIICRIEGLAACIRLCLLPMLTITESTWHAFCEDK
jgi:hypothetical protein